MNKLSLRNLVKNRKKKGFTLVELIIVIAIIAILAAIAIPKFGQITKNSNITADIATAKNLHGVGAQIVAEDPTKIPDSDTEDISEEVKAKVDGGNIKSKVTGTDFVVTVEDDGDIVVETDDDNKAYPEQTGVFAKSNSNS